ncbi:MAG TPA: tetratricopeptide repeat protein, partial [Vicinamibacteria bacterium]|nr:tetratricopeptide repeat protein [Vicinamibacteria bacterium]
GPDFLHAVQHRRVAEHRRRAARLQGEGHRAEAEAELTEALALLPGNAETLTALGFLRLQAGRLPEATGSLEAARAADPAYPPAVWGLALAAERSGDARAARAHYEAYLRLSPRTYEAWQARLALRRLPP